MEQVQHNIGVQSDLGRLKRKYHKIRTENSLLKKVTEKVPSSADNPETLHVDSMTSSSSTSNAFHGGATFNDETTAASKFNGKLVESLFIIEVCAGTARLSRTAQNMGFKVMAIDHSSKRSCGMPIQCFELEDPTQVKALADFIATEHNSIAYVWFAPSCGTASRARERKQARLERMGHVLPGPLRSELQPDQMDGLSGADKLKTEKANLLYDAIYTLAVACHKNAVAFAIENPGNSHFWNTSPIRMLQQEVTHHLVSFHNCCHGGERDKLTSILVNNDWLDGLEGRCDRRHQHRPWVPTVQNNKLHFATGEEAAYPWLLCERIVHAIRFAIEQQGAINHETLEQQFSDQNQSTTQRLVLGALPRGMKLKPLVAEFIDYTYVISNPQDASFLEANIASLPKGARVTSRQLGTGAKMRDEILQKLHDKTVAIEKFEGEQFEVCTIGMPGDPETFLERAFKAGHPRSLDGMVNELVDEVAKKNFHGDMFELASMRINFFKHWSARAKELESKQCEMLKSAPAHAAKVLAGKRVALLQEILESIDYPDTTLVSEMVQGFPLTGWMTKSGIFPPRVRRPKFDKATLVKLAKGINHSTLRSMDRRQDNELEQGAWDETCKELMEGWLWKDAHCSGDVVIAKRFGLRQGPKIRVIDDCSVCGLNATVGLREKFRIHNIDQLATMMAHSFNIAKGQHPKVVGRTYDLKSAYKQFPISEEARRLLRIAVHEPGKEEPHLMGLDVLPFGAVASVAAFLRISMAVWFIGIRCLGLYWSAFYDDFSVVCRNELSSNTAWACESLFKLLGLRFAQDGSKATPFDSKFKMLGLVVDLTESHLGTMSICHTAERGLELTAAVDKVLTDKTLSVKDAERLRGRMIFFEGLTYGRTANTSIKNLGRFCVGDRAQSLDDEAVMHLEFLKDRIASRIPIVISKTLYDTWYLFTDGACEPEARKGSVGGVVFAPNFRCISFFSAEIPADFMDAFLSKSKNPIHEIELLPAWFSIVLWRDLIKNSQAVHFIDNESSRMALVKGYGETFFGKRIVCAHVDQENALQLRSWYARVPSFSNIADGPSRMDCALVTRLGGKQIMLPWERFLHVLR